MATGKTSAANALAPHARSTNFDDEEQDPIHWEHLYFALPVYRMAAARQKIVGMDAIDRQYYEIHDALVDLFKGYITYEETVDTVYEIVHMDCPPEGTKPRQFLQYVATDICRKFDPDCFVKWMNRKVNEEFVTFEAEQNRLEEIHDITNLDDPFFRKTFGVVLSDLRFPNECEFVYSHPNGVLIRLEARPEVVLERCKDRDGFSPDSAMQQHRSEQAIADVPEEWFSGTIDTSDLLPQEKIQHIYKILREHV